MRTASNRRRRPRTWPVLTLAALALGCAAGACLRLKRAARAELDIEALRARPAAAVVYILPAAETEGSVPAAVWVTPTPVDPSAERVRTLQRENPELVGWLTAEGAGMSLPVMQSPSDPDFYLDHDFAGESSRAGLPYIDAACDAREGLNLIIYGHNMNNGTMFGSLKRYLDADFFAANAQMRYDTAEESLRCRVIAVYRTTIDENAAFRFWTYTDIADEEAYREYAANILARSAHDADGLPDFGKRLLTLVTCVRYHPNDRLIVVAAEQ